jgi:lipopolysaccharide/colanic/teichoic acid biosynthesis glycosyltransferase
MWLLFNKILKRTFDVIIALIAIILLSPIFFICVIWIKIDSKGPILFKQERLTKKGQVFRMIKFRSMIVNAEKLGTGLFNYENDPRVTKSGKFLRNYSLDELPQLFNVIKGDMSIVGPRPCVVYELGDYKTLNQRFKKRFEVISGITGLAQVQGRNELTWDIKVYFDNLYIDLFRKWGVLLDLKIIVQTIVNVFMQEKIYERKIDDSLSDIKAAEFANEEVIKKAHAIDKI